MNNDISKGEGTSGSAEMPDKRECPGINASERNSEFIKEVCGYLTENMDKKITVAQLSEHLGISKTNLKNLFREIFHMPVYAFIKTKKMEAAAEALRTTDDTVLGIAGQFGYDNGSKFAKAFKSVMGKSPREYRVSANNEPENR